MATTKTSTEVGDEAGTDDGDRQKVRVVAVAVAVARHVQDFQSSLPRPVMKQQHQ